MMAVDPGCQGQYDPTASSTPQHLQPHIDRQASSSRSATKRHREIMETMSQDGYTLAHISHLHDLHLTDIPAGAPPPKCHACGLDCARSAYQCAPCGYAMHPACARTGRTVRHPAHPEHPLSLRLATPYPSDIYTCDACRTGGHEFVLHCHHCQFDLHLPCAALPADAVASCAHPHPLTLAYDSPHRGKPGVVVICTVCAQGIIPEQWFYGCSACVRFAAHVGCAVPDAQIKIVYPRIDMQKERAEQEASKTAALLQQYQQMSALIGAQSSMFASNTASMLNAMQGLNLGARMSNDNLAINFNSSGTADQNRKREEYYKRRNGR